MGCADGLCSAGGIRAAPPCTGGPVETGCGCAALQDVGALAQLLDAALRPTAQHVAGVESELLACRAELTAYQESAAAHRQREEKVRPALQHPAELAADCCC